MSKGFDRVHIARLPDLLQHGDVVVGEPGHDGAGLVTGCAVMHKEGGHSASWLMAELS